MQRRVRQGAGFIVFAMSLALTAPVAAKDVRVEPYATPPADAPLTPEESAKLERTLNFDALAVSTRSPARSLNEPTLTRPQHLDVSRSAHADGSSTVTVKRSLSSDWNAKVGADVDVAADPTTTYEPGKSLPSEASDKDKPSGAAFASLGVSRFTTVDARVDPSNERGQLGATIEHSVPLGGDMSVTLRSRYTATDTLAPAAAQSTEAPVLSNNQAVKFNIGSTGTTLSAGVSADSVDPKTHNTLSADQKVYGPLHVTTAITDAGQPTSNKSVTARFQLTW
jgi:hypothetical protein